jgi:plastocyanin
VLRRASTLFALAALSVVWACGSGQDPAVSGGHDNSPVPDGARRIEVLGRDYAFEPDLIEVQAGEAVAIELTSRNEEHDFKIDELDAYVGANDGDTEVGGFTAPVQPGTYVFYCTISNHQSLGMEGELVVTGG